MFQVGDRVVWKDAYAPFGLTNPETYVGSIITLEESGVAGVRWDEYDRGRWHDLGGECERGHGFWVNTAFLNHYFAPCEEIEIDDVDWFLSEVLQ